MAASLRAKFEEHLSCPICLEQLKDPRVLPCLHSYCLECLAKLDMTGNRIICPECRTTVKVGDPPDVSVLPSNFFAKNLLATMSLTSESAATSIVCENCDSEGPAETRCTHCNRYLCGFCTDVHGKMRDTKAHVLMSMSELKASGQSMIIAETIHCPKHNDEIIKLYCSTCQTTICRDCTVIDHRDHDYSFVKDVALKQKGELKALVEEVKAKKDKISQMLTGHFEREERLNAKIEATVGEINDYFDKMSRVIAKHRNELVEQTISIKNSKQKQLHARREQFEMTLASCESSIEFTERAFESGNDTQILNMKKYIARSLQTLRSEKTKTQPEGDDYIEFVNDYSIEHFDGKVNELCCVVDEKECAENCTISFKFPATNKLNVGNKYEVVITSKDSRGRRCRRRGQVVTPRIDGVKVSNLSVADKKDGCYTISFVPRGVGELLFTLLINGKHAPRCAFTKDVIWAMSHVYGEGPLCNGGWTMIGNGLCDTWSYRIANCYFESGSHSWRVKVEHSGCRDDECYQADIEIGVIDHDFVHDGADLEVVLQTPGYRSVLEAYTEHMAFIWLELNMTKKKLTITPSWGTRHPVVLEVREKVSPYFATNCTYCSIAILEMN